MRLLRSSHGVAAAAVALAVLGITMIALGECRSAVNSPRMRCAWSVPGLAGAALRAVAMGPSSPAHLRVVCMLQVSAAHRGTS
jgi:hypothetical protein